MPIDALDSEPDYFAMNCSAVRVGVPGLRRGQRAAIHALIGHLTLKSEPAIAVLPTGAGKTDVAILLPYLLSARRVVIVVPSDSVRGQVAKRFETLSVLKKIGVLPEDTTSPKILKLANRISSKEDWDELRSFDVVVTTPHSISPALKGVLQPPADLFDLLLIDEAHHSPAKTWQAVLDAFPQAKRALFTATPFRRDKKQIKGTIVANYSLRDARKDGVFGDIEYHPVSTVPGEDSNVAIAKSVEHAFCEDQKAGLKHSILVRASSIPHAEALLELYGRETSLKLEVIHSQYSSKRIENAIKLLENQTLDGVICVNMLGEGFDQPSLKIAALHAPHASLGVTLQFIGRFARVGDDSLGKASFFAVPSEIEGEMESLFHEDSVWPDLIVNLAQTRVLLEDQIRSDLATFQTPEVQESGMEEVSLYALRPGFHVKVYRVPEDVDVRFGRKISLPRPFEVMYSQSSEDLSVEVLIAREQQRPRWSDQLRFGRTEYELFVVHFAPDAGLLFICASRRADSMYRAIAKEYIGEAFKGLPLYMINRVLSGLSKVECFSIGMKNRLHSAKQESYRILAGHGAHQAIRKSDGRLFHQGHVFCTANDEAQKRITIGYSSGSKIWSTGKGSIPQLIRWCSDLSRKIVSTNSKVSAPGLDILEVGVPLVNLPTNVFAVDWDPLVYEESVEVEVDGIADPLLLADLSLRIDRTRSSGQILHVMLDNEDTEWDFEFQVSRSNFFTQIDGPTVIVVHAGDRLSLADFLNEYPLYFYCTDLAKIHGDEFFPSSSKGEPFDRNLITPISWATEGVNPEREFWKKGQATGGKLSIHGYLEKTLDQAGNNVVLYDHRSGEVADFLTIAEGPQTITLSLHHCKGAGGSNAGDRVGDVYEVCGQVVKSFNLALDEKLLLKHVRRRVNKGKVRSRFIRGSVSEIERIFRESAGKRLAYRFVIVQPGISQSRVSADSLSVLAAANEFVHSLGASDVVVLGSN
jgi:superfamily II DNA or RNA helicase